MCSSLSRSKMVSLPPIKRLLIALMISIAFIIIFRVYFDPRKSIITLRRQKTEDLEDPRPKIILAVTKWYGQQKKWECPNLNCRFSTNPFDLCSADIILFHIWDFNPETAPVGLGPWQRSVFMHEEPPPNTHPNLRLLANGFRFNWTMTYRLDSDIVQPYGKLEMLPRNSTKGFGKDLEEIWSKKKRMALWMASNCHSASKRELIVQALQKHIEVDVWGACGNDTACARNSAWPECTERLSSDYRFYLAFENSICDDYTTEKFYTRWQLNLVVVVLKRKLLERLIPAELRGKKLFIALDDFSTVEGFAEHLKFLAKNKTEYLKYFEWKSKVKTLFYSELCQICEKLFNYSDEVKWYPDIYKWWHDGGHCENDTVLSRVPKY